MLILVETAAGYALFKIASEKKLKKIDDIYSYLEDTDQAKKLVSLQAFQKFKHTQDALKSTSKLIKGKIPKSLNKFLQNNVISQEIQDNMAVADKKLGKSIQESLGIECQTGDLDLFRGIRLQIQNLVAGLTEDELKKMTLGLAHGLSRYKLKFSSEKVDTMIIQAISLLDDLDKEINNYMMRLREWYGWHFPEISKIITDNLTYAKTIKMIGMKTNTHKTDLSDLLPEEIEKEVKQAAEISMGTEIGSDDEKYILQLADQVIELTEYRSSLSEYLTNRMQAIAPNLTTLVGELVGARLISHAGSLVNLAKYPASTVQILGAEKALFKAIRAKANTPKYGLLYQASMVGSAPTKIKGKVSRALAAKCAICIRCDALGENEMSEIGIEAKVYLEKRISFLENSEGFRPSEKPKTSAAQTGSAVKQYNPKGDMVMSTFKKGQTLEPYTKRKANEVEGSDDEEEVVKQSSIKKKVKK